MTRSEAEWQARRKLDRINARAGREYGQDGYGDEYLEILTEEFLYLSACALFLEQDCKRKMEARGQLNETFEMSSISEGL